MAFQYETVQAWITSVTDRQRNIGLVAPSVESLYKTPSSTRSKGSVAVNSLRHVFNTHVRGEPLNTGPRNLAPRNQKKRSIVRCQHMYIRLFCFVRVHMFDGQMDGRMDRCQQQELTSTCRCALKLTSVEFSERAKLNSQVTARYSEQEETLLFRY